MTTLLHRHGGTIASLSAIAHGTHNGVATWYFIGHVKWRDGTYSTQAQIPPNLLCHDDTDVSKAELSDYIDMLNAYLNDAGTWHEPKTKHDGRVYTWTPYKPAGSLAIR